MPQDYELKPMPLDEPVTDEEVAWLEAAARRGRRAEETMCQILIEQYGEEEACRHAPHVWLD